MAKQNKEDLRSRRGRFTVTRGLLIDTVGFFKPFNIIDANSNLMSDEVEYLALSPLFDPIPDSQKAPEYTIECSVDRMGNMQWKAERLYEGA